MMFNKENRKTRERRKILRVEENLHNLSALALETDFKMATIKDKVKEHLSGSK